MDGLFGRSSTRNVARNVQCTGSESLFSSCSYTLITSSSGLAYESYISVGVFCQGSSAFTGCQHGAVRLVGGQKISEGRVEICASGYWSTVCNSNWDIVETEIVCRQLDFPTNGK